jgi:hypothetical protein
VEKLSKASTNEKAALEQVCTEKSLRLQRRVLAYHPKTRSIRRQEI